MRVQPKYIAISEKIKKDIQLNQLPKGYKLETENSLIERFNVSRQTIRKALDVLVSEGVLYKTQGSGTYVNLPAIHHAKTNTIGLIGLDITQYIFPQIVRSIEQELFKKNYRLALSVTDNRVGYEREILLRFIESPVDGLIVQGSLTSLPNPNLDLYRKLQSIGVPIVFYDGYYDDLENSVRVHIDYYQSTYEAMQYLISLGHTRIGGIFKCDELKGVLQRKAYLQAIIDAGLPIHDEDVMLFLSQHSTSLPFAQNLNFKDKFHNCTAVFCFNDLVAITLMQHLKETGRNVPQDVSIIGVDNSESYDFSHAKLTSIDLQKEKIGRLCAQKIVKLINGQNVKSEVLAHELIIRSTTSHVSKID